MSVEFVLTPAQGRPVALEALSDLLRSMFPCEMTRAAERTFSFSFADSSFTVEVDADLRETRIVVPLAHSTDAGLRRPAALGLLLAARFGWRCIDGASGRDLLEMVAEAPPRRKRRARNRKQRPPK